MSLLGSGKRVLNLLLAPLNLRLESRTAEKEESRRLAKLVNGGHFGREVFPVLGQFADADPSDILDAVKRYAPQLEKFKARDVPDQYSYDNDYFPSADAEVLYAITRIHKPRRIVEVGSGNSTLLFRAAVHDECLDTQLTAIDPHPQREIERHADQVIRARIEAFASDALFAGLQRNDFLFIDSSHELKAGNDVLKLFLRVLPALAPGVIVHIHDIFLPFDYPQEWIVTRRWPWTEQYLLQALLQGSSEFDVLWAGHFLQRSLPGFAGHFRHYSGAAASSLWLRRAGGKANSGTIVE